MRGGGLKIGRILGIPIYLHTSWFFIFALVTYSFYSEFGLPLALLTSALFFGSVLFHELSHSVVAIRYRIPVASITLFFFGGVARISREPDSASQEFQIAIAGPLSSYFLAGAFWLLMFVSPAESSAFRLGHELRFINFMLATFNLVPGFPLDGGRILRSIIWGITGNYTRATRVAARAGQAIACAMIALGLWQAFGGSRDFEGGLWFALIGWFLLGVARQSYAQVAARGALEGLHVSDVMSRETPTIARDLSLEEYAREVSRTGRGTHLVVSGDRLAGLVNVQALQAVPREEWPMTSVQAVMLPRARMECAAPSDSALHVLETMRGANIDQMAVMEGENIAGVVTLDSLMRVAQARTDLKHVPAH